MNADQLREAVAQSTKTSWPDFAREHPALAGVIDQAMLSEMINHSLAEDPEFQKAYGAAIEANVGAQAMANLLDRFVAPALRRLV